MVETEKPKNNLLFTRKYKKKELYGSCLLIFHPFL